VGREGEGRTERLTIILQGGGRVTVGVEHRRLQRAALTKTFGACGNGGGHQAQFVPVIDRRS